MGKIKDERVGRGFSSNYCGDFEVIEYTKWNNVSVKFRDTGSVVTGLRWGHIVKGSVRDPLHRTVLGIGYIGLGKYKVRENGEMSKPYRVWMGMLVRCYSTCFHKNNPTYVGCTVCDEWHNYQTFCQWFYLNYKEGLVLDKDGIVAGNRVYSPSTCKFITATENSVLAQAKSYNITTPKGKVVEVYNLKAYCNEHRLTSSAMSQVALGRRSHHRGYTCKYAYETDEILAFPNDIELETKGE